MAQQQREILLDDNGEPIQQPNEIAVTIGGQSGVLLDDQGNLINSQLPDAAKLTQAPGAEQSSSGLRDYVAGALPSIGGMVGSLVGGGIGGAALGGAAGQGYGELLKHAGEIPGAVADVARNAFSQPKATFQGFMSGAGEGLANAGISGGIQGATEAIGQPIGKALYWAAMRPPIAVMNKVGGIRGLPKLLGTGYINRIMPTLGGTEKAGRLVEKSRDAQTGMAQAYDAAGKPQLSVMKAAVKGLGPEIALADAAQEATGAGAQVAGQISDQVTNVLAQGGPAVSATKMIGRKRSADAIADPAYKAAALPGAQPVARGTEPHVAKGWSKGYRQVLNKAVGPEFAQQGQQTKMLFNVGRMAENAAKRPEMLANIVGGAAAVPQAWEDPVNATKTFLLYRALADPRSLAAMSFAAPQAGRAVDAATGGVGTDLLRRALLAQLEGNP